MPHYKPHKVLRMVLAVTVLHNMCILAQVLNYFEEDELNDFRNNNFHDNEDLDDPEGGEHYLDVLRRGRIAREEVVQHLEDRQV